jgi:hypothetical protein
MLCSAVKSIAKLYFGSPYVVRPIRQPLFMAHYWRRQMAFQEIESLGRGHPDSRGVTYAGIRNAESRAVARRKAQNAR